MKKYEIRSIDKNINGSYVINYCASENGHTWLGHNQYYGYSKREALRQAREDLNIKRNPCAIYDYTKRS